MIGKTGTAQIASPKGGYLKGETDYTRSFAGIFPEDDPKYIVYVVTHKLGASNANPIAKELTSAVDKIAAYLGLEENKTEKVEKIIKLDNYISKEISKVKEELKDKNLNIYTLGNGKYVINQYPLKGNDVIDGSKLFLLTNDTNYVMEDLKGWSLNEVRTYTNLLGINLNTEGYGYVVNQSITPGEAIDKSVTLNVTLSK
jgi:penicillin-binding protein 2B